MSRTFYDDIVNVVNVKFRLNTNVYNSRDSIPRGPWPSLDSKNERFNAYFGRGKFSNYPTRPPKKQKKKKMNEESY